MSHTCLFHLLQSQDFLLVLVLHDGQLHIFAPWTVDKEEEKRLE